MLKKVLGVFLLSAGATGLFLMPSGAEAKWERTSAQACVAENGAVWRNQIGLANYGGGIGGVNLEVFCPVRDDYYFRKQDIRGVNLHGRDQHSGDAIYARTCVSYWNTWAGECGYYSSSGTYFVGNATVTPSVSVWGSSHAADFGYLFALVPQGGSSLNGFFTYD